MGNEPRVSRGNAVVDCVENRPTGASRKRDHQPLANRCGDDDDDPLPLPLRLTFAADDFVFRNSEIDGLPRRNLVFEDDEDVDDGDDDDDDDDDLLEKPMIKGEEEEEERP